MHKGLFRVQIEGIKQAFSYPFMVVRGAKDNIP